MSSTNPSYMPGRVDSDSEDDLDLDELDPIVEPINSSANPATGARHASSNIPLNRLQQFGGTRLWRSAGRRDKPNYADPDGDTEGLLGGWPGQSTAKGHLRQWSEDPVGWNVRQNRTTDDERGSNTPSQPRDIPSRRSSFRQSMQLSDFVRQELADMREDQDANSKQSREVGVGQVQSSRYPTNVVSNAKYTAWSFLPRTLYNEFSFFLNIYFLLVALSQIIPFLRIGYMSTYIVPLACVLAISIGKEALDDITRRRRDAEANSEPFTVVSFGDFARPRQLDPRNGVLEVQKRARDIRVGDILKLEKNQRVPADVVILQSHLSETPSDPATSSPGDLDTPATSPTSAETFIRTDQLDGETDWKLRLPSP